jgi:hypothetical protein
MGCIFNKIMVPKYPSVTVVFKFDLWIPEDWMKGSVATTARGWEMPNITAESAMPLY